MITANVFRRTFFIRFKNSTGTAFTIDVEKKQYLVTARHVCIGVGDDDKIGIFHDGQFEEMTVKVVGLGSTDEIDTDVAVFALENQISPSFPMVATSEGLVWGQDVYFLGFPYGLHTSVGVKWWISLASCQTSADVGKRWK